jgi:glycosyltransferase involved in cell wall biosynthesis
VATAAGSTSPPRSRAFWPESAGKGLEPIQYRAGGLARETSVSWTRLLERGLCYAYGCWEALESQRPRPVDIVLGRSAGLGSTLFTPVCFPGVTVVNQFDYFYHAHAHDLAEEAGPDTPVGYYHWRRAANAMTLLELENGVVPWAPTAWQRDLFPAEYHHGFVVLYDGVDGLLFTRPSRPTTHAPRVVAGRVLGPEVRVVSFVARELDRLRGFERFMELANRLQRARPDVVCAVIGGSPVQRGLDIQFYQKDYKAHVLAQTPPHDPDRFWFLGAVPQAVVTGLLAASDVHVYPGRPYVVSRSLAEAMAAGCVILAGDTAPVREFLTHGETGLLVPAADPDSWERQALAVLADPAAHRPLGEAAAMRARERYSRDATLPALAELFGRLVEGGR